MTTQDQNSDIRNTSGNQESTPRYIQYGAALLLGIAFGAGGYVLINGVPADSSHATAGLIQSTAKHISHNTMQSKDLPSPFDAAFEPSVEQQGTAVGEILRETANAESVEPSAPADYPINE